MFWNNYVRLCRRYGFTPTGVGRKLGLSKGTVSNWKYGGYPRADNLIKIAQFFHITVEELEGVLVLDTDDSKSYDIDFKEIVRVSREFFDKKHQAEMMSNTE